MEKFADIGWNDSQFALDEAHVFWVSEAGEVMKKPKAGGATEILARYSRETTTSGWVWVGVDDRFVYWREASNGELRTVPKDGGDMQLLSADCVVLAMGFGGVLCSTTKRGVDWIYPNTPERPALNPSMPYVYYTHHSQTGGWECSKHPERFCGDTGPVRVVCDVWRARPGEDPEVVVAGRCGRLVNVMGEIATLEDSGKVVGVSAHPGKVLLHTHADDVVGDRKGMYLVRHGYLDRAAFNGDNPSSVVAGWSEVGQVEIDDEHVYWLSPRQVEFDAAIERIPRPCHRALANPDRIPLGAKSIEGATSFDD